MVMVVQVVLFDLLLEHLQLPDAGNGHLVLVRHQRSVKVQRKGYEYDEHWDEDDARGPGGRRVEVVELDPAQDGNLEQEQDQPEQGREGPRRLDVPVEPLVGRLVHQGDAVQIADGFDVRQDAGADHEGKHVNRHQQRGADGERYQHTGRDGGVFVQLNFNHGDLKVRMWKF